MTKAKPDCTGQRFGRLVVLGKGEKRHRPDRGTYRQLWRCQCDCGKIIEIERGSFENKGQISCGCARKLGLIDNNKRPNDIAGQRFGQLTAIALTGKKDVHKKPTWLLRCNCGNTCEFSLSAIRRQECQNIRINCKDRTRHPENCLTYPPAPTPYPKDAGELLVKYLHLTEVKHQQINSAVEDKKRDRLLRACWIITYRRQQGEIITNLHERRIIQKHLRYCSIDVFWRRKIEEKGGLLYDTENRKREIEIGSKMTNPTSQDYPVIETQGISMLPKNIKKKFSFKRR